MQRHWHRNLLLCCNDNLKQDPLIPFMQRTSRSLLEEAWKALPCQINNTLQEMPTFPVESQSQRPKKHWNNHSDGLRIFICCFSVVFHRHRWWIFKKRSCSAVNSQQIESNRYNITTIDAIDIFTKNIQRTFWHGCFHVINCLSLGWRASYWCSCLNQRWKFAQCTKWIQTALNSAPNDQLRFLRLIFSFDWTWLNSDSRPWFWVVLLEKEFCLWQTLSIKNQEKEKARESVESIEQYLILRYEKYYITTH